MNAHLVRILLNGKLLRSVGGIEGVLVEMSLFIRSCFWRGESVGHLRGLVMVRLVLGAKERRIHMSRLMGEPLALD